MSSQMDSIQPPRFAVWLIGLFEEAESIQGDLLEEFSHLVSVKGTFSARQWYWRQTVGTIPHLFVTGFRTAPWTVATVVIGSFLLRWLVSTWSTPVIGRTIDAVLSSNGVYERDPQAYVFWLTSSMLAVHLVVNALTGVFVGFAARGREMTATIILGLIGIGLALQSTLLTVAKTGDYAVISTLLHTAAFSMAIVFGGAAVRTYRLHAATRRVVT